MTAPYLTDTVPLDKDLTGADFCVALAHDGKTGSLSFNKWVDKAYKKCPIFAVVKPDPNYYHAFTLGTWPHEIHDAPIAWMKSHFLAPDGKTKYAIAGVIIDMRNIYNPRGELYSGNWVSGVAKHWREYLTRWGFKTYLFYGPALEAAYPDNSKDPAVFCQIEFNPTAVYETTGGLTCKWPKSKFIKRISVDSWESCIPIAELYKMIGWTAPVAPPPPVIVEPPEMTDAEKLDYCVKTCDRLNEFMDMLKSWQY